MAFKCLMHSEEFHGSMSNSLCVDGRSISIGPENIKSRDLASSTKGFDLESHRLASMDHYVKCRRSCNICHVPPRKEINS